jgi:membrane associated rhomboid family serine protease/Flp pilus assembly protein TadD
MANCAQCGRKLPAFVFGRKICQWCVQHEAAQRGEEPANAIQPLMAVPWAGGSGGNSMVLTQVFFGINVAVFIAMTLAQGSLADFSSQALVHWGGNAGSLTFGGDWWRLITCLFVHGGIIHIAFNMWCLWDLGRLCESLYGHWTFGAVYLIAGLGASVASLVWQPNGLSVGASGAIFGLAGALIASYYLGEFSMPRSAITGTLRSVVVFVGYSLIFGAMSGHTDNAAHVGGLVTGLALGALIAKGAPDPSRPVRRVAVLLIALMGVSGVLVVLQHAHGYLIHTQRANELLTENKPDQAIAELQRVIRERPDFVPAHYVLAQAYLHKLDLANAETELKRVLELRPDDEETSYELGAVYLEEKHPQQARDMFTQMLTQNPLSSDAHFGLGLVDDAEEKYQDAVRQYTAAAGLNSSFSDVYYLLGLAQFKLKNYDDAIAAFQKDQQNNGDNSKGEKALADAYRAKGLTQQADDAMRKAAEFRNPPQ